MSAKIATCCYCGTRAVLRLAGGVRHELACRSCGAPLRELKQLRADHGGDRHLVPPSRVRGLPVPKKSGKPKKRGVFRMLGKIADEVEDFFDDLLD